jgi:hypothetical protein
MIVQYLGIAEGYVASKLVVTKSRTMACPTYAQDYTQKGLFYGLDLSREAGQVRPRARHHPADAGHPVKPYIIPTLLGLLLLVSPTIEKAGEIDQLPPIKMNRHAGQGHLLFVTLGLKNTKNLTFVLDTGNPYTLLDSRYEPELGRPNKMYEPEAGKYMTNTVIWMLGTNFTAHAYDYPGIYLGDQVLMKSGPYIFTCDLSTLSKEAGHKIDGILGMDVLENYCVQLDFKSKKISFLDDTHLDKDKLGKAFPLTQVDSDFFCIADNLAGAHGQSSLIDTGNISDGWLTPQLFQSWRNPAPRDLNVGAHFPDATLGGERYHHVYPLCSPTTPGLEQKFRLNGIGLLFLSRHVVTLDFPNETMYLQRIR